MQLYKFVFSPLQVNTYLLADKKGNCAIIDCSCFNTGEFSDLEKFIESHKLNPVILLNTHCHLDHIFGNKLMLEKFNLRTFSHQLEEENRKNALNHAMLFGLSMEEPPECAGFISDKQRVYFGEASMLSLHVPGHTAGSLAFYCEEDGWVFTGDALFSGSIGRTDLHGGNYQTLIKSIKDQLLTLPPDTIVYPGHGPETTIAKEMSSNPYLT
jgi:hydroxyacylglutathione hydrolase